MEKTADIYFQVDPWKVVEEGFDPSYSRVSESVFSLGNESTGVRGFFEEGGSVDSLRGAYTNGVRSRSTAKRSISARSRFRTFAVNWTSGPAR